jgi:hypothetical protein
MIHSHILEFYSIFTQILTVWPMVTQPMVVSYLQVSRQRSPSAMRGRSKWSFQMLSLTCVTHTLSIWVFFCPGYEFEQRRSWVVLLWSGLSGAHSGWSYPGKQTKASVVTAEQCDRWGQCWYFCVQAQWSSCSASPATVHLAEVLITSRGHACSLSFPRTHKTIRKRTVFSAPPGGAGEYWNELRTSSRGPPGTSRESSATT